MLGTRSTKLLCLALLASSAGCAAVSSEPRLHTAHAADGVDCAAHALACCPKRRSDRVTLCQLFAEMIDLSQLTRAPEPGYTSHMQSSFNRASRGARPGDETWLTNRDFAQLTPDEPLRVLDVEGPGVVTRVWSANPSGTLRVYLDGSQRPAIEAPMRELLRGEIAPFRTPFASAAAGGYNLYLPISYQSHCTITVTSDAKKLFYQVNYRRYSQHVHMESFDAAVLDQPQHVAASAAAVLAAPAPAAFAEQRERCTLSTLDGGACSVRAADGGRMLTELQIQIHDPTPAALRETLLHIRVDGVDTVRVPLGDFFGTGPGLQTVAALPLQVRANTGSFVARWPMPLQRELRVTLEASGAVPLAAEVTLSHEPHPVDANTLLFHALWRAPEWHASKPSHLFNLVTLEGSGFYVGTLLNVTNSDAGWWGEGDEQIWVDDESFPSFFGTGTEDYFGYGWCSNERFSRAYVGQTLTDPHANFGRVSQYRFHVLDAIPFTKRLRFDLEVNHWGDQPVQVAYDGIVYFYARPGVSVRPALSEAARYRIAELNVAAPQQVPEGSYRCGGDN